jgi:hypothetical protein
MFDAKPLGWYFQNFTNGTGAATTQMLARRVGSRAGELDSCDVQSPEDNLPANKTIVLNLFVLCPKYLSCDLTNGPAACPHRTLVLNRRH